jgi:hypothetical protein
MVGAARRRRRQRRRPLTHDAHWGDNIHNYGVVDGIGHSFADAGSAFVKDNVETSTR